MQTPEVFQCFGKHVRNKGFTRVFSEFLHRDGTCGDTCPQPVHIGIPAPGPKRRGENAEEKIHETVFGTYHVNVWDERQSLSDFFCLKHFSTDAPRDLVALEALAGNSNRAVFLTGALDTEPVVHFSALLLCTALVDEPKLEDIHIGMALQPGNYIPKDYGPRQNVVAVEERQPRPRCQLTSVFPCKQCAFVAFLSQNFESVVYRCVVLADCTCSICGTVINDNKLRLLQRLFVKTLKAITNVRFNVVC